MAHLRKTREDTMALSAELRTFIDSAIVPALVKEWLAQNNCDISLAPSDTEIENPNRLAANSTATQEAR